MAGYAGEACPVECINTDVDGIQPRRAPLLCAFFEAIPIRRQGLPAYTFDLPKIVQDVIEFRPDSWLTPSQA